MPKTFINVGRWRLSIPENFAAAAIALSPGRENPKDGLLSVSIDRLNVKPAATAYLEVVRTDLAGIEEIRRLAL